jgi:hypothetical protein
MRLRFFGMAGLSGEKRTRRRIPEYLYAAKHNPRAVHYARTACGRAGAAGAEAMRWQKPPMPLTVAMHCSYDVKKQWVSPSLA